MKVNVRSFRSMLTNLTVRYVAALCTIALLVSSSPFLVLDVLDQQEAYRRLIILASNLSDISQSISRSSIFYRLHPNEIEKQKIKALVAKVENLSSRFRQETFDLSIPESQSTSFQKHLHEMDLRVQEFIYETNLLLRTAGPHETPLDIIEKTTLEAHQLSDAIRASIADLEGAVFEKIQNFKTTEMAFTILTLLVLVLQGLFVLRPAVSRVGETLVDLNNSESQLIDAKEQAVEALKIRSEFITKISHEIRNPLNAILGMGDLLWETTLNMGQRRYVEIFQRAGQSILDLINEFLDFSRLESGRMELEKIPYDLVDTVERALDIVSTRAEDKGLELNLDFDWTLPTELLGDPKKVQQILINLLGNAVKFTSEGEVNLKVQKEVDQVGNDKLIFTISDTGIGIPKDRQSKIFDSFVQVDPSISRKFGGTGLGLAICKELTKLMRGHLFLKSDEGRGSTFTVQIPLETAGAETFVDRFKKFDLSHFRAGILDQNQGRGERIAKLLNLLNLTVSSIKHSDTSLADLHFDIVLTDQVFLPEILDLEKQFLQDWSPRIIVFSQLKDLNQISSRVATNSKFVCIPKPIKPTQLFQVLLDMQKGIQVTTFQPLVEAKTDILPEAHVLIVEDSDDNRLVLRTYLKNTPIQATFAVNGKDGLDKFINGKFDLVFMDIQMPEMDGFAATREIRNFEKSSNKIGVPIIALTAYGHKEEIQKCLDAGCNRHMTKPIRRAAFLKALGENV